VFNLSERVSARPCLQLIRIVFAQICATLLNDFPHHQSIVSKYSTLAVCGLCLLFYTPRVLLLNSLRRILRSVCRLVTACFRCCETLRAILAHLAFNCDRT
jgi:hypothetical protein